VYYRKKLDYQEARVKQLLKRPACMLTSLRLSRNLNSQEDYNKRMTYCRWFQTFVDENPEILDYTWFSDEAWFHLSGYVNSQNTRLWGSENSHALFEEPLHSQKDGVFCALSQLRIIGPKFNTTVTNRVYIELFREFVIS
jgi:hypothetical protein